MDSIEALTPMKNQTQSENIQMQNNTTDSKGVERVRKNPTKRAKKKPKSNSNSTSIINTENENYMKSEDNTDINQDEQLTDFSEKFNEIKRSSDKKENCLHIINIFENLLDRIDETDPIKVISSTESLESLGIKYVPSPSQKNSSIFDIRSLLDEEEKRILNGTINVKNSTNSSITSSNEITNTTIKNNTNTITNSKSLNSNCTLDDNSYNKNLNLHKMLLETREMKNLLVSLYLRRKLEKLKQMRENQINIAKKQHSPPIFNEKEIARYIRIKF